MTSSKIIALIIIGLLLILGGTLVYFKQAEAPTSKGDLSGLGTAYENKTLGFSFDYSYRYYLREREAGTRLRPQTAIVLVEDTIENRDLLDGISTESREGPTAITIDIYENPTKLGAEEWIEQDTNWNLSNKQVTPASVGGKEGRMFTWDGLYAGKSTVVTHGERTYVFSVTSMTREDRILKDYDTLLASVTFE